ISSRRSSGSTRAEGAVEPTRSQNITVSCRRSAPPEIAAEVNAVVTCDASLRRAASAASSFRRWPIELTPRPSKSSAVNSGSTSASMWLAAKAGAYCSRPSRHNQSATLIDIAALPPGYRAAGAPDSGYCRLSELRFRGDPIMSQSEACLTVVAHPLVQHKLSLMRDRATSTAEFRRLLREISLLLAYEATRELPLEDTEIETPLESGAFPLLAGKKLCLVSILRAGNGILDGMLDLLPSARVGHIGIYRDPRTLQAIEYYLKLPEDLAERDVVLVDPMLATGNSAVAAISRLKELAARSTKFVCLVAAPEGVDKVSSIFPDVPIVVAALDRCLDEHGYILPGLGDAGDRLFGTK